MYPVQLARHESELGTWERFTREAEPRLRPYVTGYFDYTESRSLGRRREVPSTVVPIIINFESSLSVSTAGRPEEITEFRFGFTAGLIDSYVDTESSGPAHGVQVDFTPLGARLFFGLPMSELANRNLDLEDVLGAEGRRLVEQLHDAPRPDERFAMLDSYIVGRFAEARPPSEGIAWAWQRLTEADGDVNIRALAEALGCSGKHLVAQFRDQIGFPPKTVARMLRFDRVIRTIERGAVVGWADVADDCGYYDQAHFNREFREFAGCTPSDFLARRLPDGGGVRAE